MVLHARWQRLTQLRVHFTALLMYGWPTVASQSVAVLAKVAASTGLGLGLGDPGEILGPQRGCDEIDGHDGAQGSAARP